MEENKIPPKTEWKNLSQSQLYDVKVQMMNTYYNMRASNASFANQYLGFIAELDALIQRRTEEQEEEQN